MNPLRRNSRGDCKDSTAAIKRQASDWLALKEGRSFTPDELATFNAWCAADPRHAAAVAELESTWQTLDRLAHYPRTAGAAEDPDLFARRTTFLRRPVFMTLAAAASIAVVAFMWSSRLTLGSRGESAEIVATETNSSRILRLSDGSEIELKADSEVVEQFTPTERRVHLLRGEAHFTVAKNAERPFFVDAQGVSVRAVGTAFDVNLDEGQVKVIVTEGRVSVEQPVPVSTTVSTPSAKFAGEPPVLVAGQRIVMPAFPPQAGQTPTPTIIESLTLGAIDQALAWQASRLVFDATPLSEVIERFNRYTHKRQQVRLELADAGLGGMRISGRFRADNVESFTELLQASFGFVAERTDGKIVLRRAP